MNQYSRLSSTLNGYHGYLPIFAVAPRIHREDLGDTVVRVGEDVKFNVHIDGEPPPTVTWTYEGGALPDACRVQDQDYLSKFALVKPARAHAGKYTITATNPNGTDSVTVTVRSFFLKVQIL